MLKTLLLFILMLGLIVTIHEGGHFLAAKAFGVYCHEFSIGMGPKLFSKKGKETIYSIRLLPIGGFVAMAGDKENELETKVDVDVPFNRTLPGIHPAKRIIVMLAGIFMNIVLALVIISMLFLSIGATVKSPEPIIASVKEGYPAQLAGIKAQDKVIKIEYDNGYSIKPKDFGELSDFLLLYDGNGQIHLTVNRDGETLKFSLDPIYSSEDGQYYIGISSSNNEIVKTNFFNCWIYGASYLIEMTKMILMSLIGLFRGVGLDQLSGPVGVYQVTSDALEYGFSTYVSLVAMLSLNVGLFNAIPLPVFDGGRVLLTLIEVAIGKPLNKNIENKIMGASFILLLVFIVLITFKDIFKLIGG